MKNQLIDWEKILSATQPLRLCFLDFDGVMNNQELYSQPLVMDKIIKHTLRGDHIFDPISCELFNRLIAETETLVFISSDVRSDTVNEKKFLPAMIEIFQMNNISCGNLVGLTPFIRPDSRGKEIAWVLDLIKQQGMSLQSYVIIDDYAKFILPEQKSSFVQCDSNKGFKEEEYKRAKEILLQN